jgi:cytidylate kinase
MKIITISREYAAGGHSIGQRVAKELGIEFYDRDIIRETAKATGMDISQIEKAEETFSRKDSILQTITPISYEQKDALFDYQSAIILKFVETRAPFVLLGRSANVILREAGIESLNVFIYSSEAHRMARAGELLNLTNPGEILRAMKKIDHDRRTYYTHYTGRRWGDVHDYDLALDSGVLGYDTCVKLICEAAQ